MRPHNTNKPPSPGMEEFLKNKNDPATERIRQQLLNPDNKTF